MAFVPLNYPQRDELIKGPMYLPGGYNSQRADPLGL